MKTLLVPCDFSEPAINAYRVALDIAAQSNGVIHLLHIIELPSVPNTIFTPVRSLETGLLRDMSSKGTEMFKKISSRYKAEGVRVVANVEFGVPSTTIVRYAKKHSIELIVMGSHGTSGLKGFFVGSNTEKIVRNSPVPVLVVKGYYKGPVKNIVFPTSLDLENQEDLVLKVKALQKFFNSHLHIVWINTPANFIPDTVTISRLNKFVKRYMLKDFTISVYNHLSEEEGIIQFAESIDADLIAMGTHGRKGLSHLMNRNMAEGIVNHGKFLLWTSIMKKH